MSLDDCVILVGGQLVDLLNSLGHALPCNVVLQVFYQVCRAVQHMHRQNPPIVHRDLKVGVSLCSVIIFLLRMFFC